MPYPNEHACRLREPGDFQSKSFVRMTRKHDGQEYSVIQARLKGDKTLTDQALRYPIDTWTEKQASAHCKDKEGTFEAAAAKESGVLEVAGDVLEEAVTLKARAQGLLKAAQAVLADKAVPKALQVTIEEMRAALRKTWKDLEDEAAEDDGEKEKEEEAVSEAERSHNDIRELLQKAVDSKRIADVNAPPNAGKYFTWVRDVYDTWFVYTLDETGKAYKRAYVIDEQAVVTLGEAVEVVATMSYVPVAEAAFIEGEFVALIEKSVRKDGTIPLKIIQPGWGASGYYSPEVLERDGPKVFAKGLQMFWNHPTPTEEAERPEGDLRNLAGELVMDARWIPNDAAGPALYADAKVFEQYQKPLDELAPHIGASIRAVGRAKPGEAQGKRGNIIEEIVRAKSVDFVTSPGAGGQVLQLFEAARLGKPQPIQEDNTVNEKEVQELRDKATAAEAKVTAAEAKIAATEAENARLKEASLFREAKEFVAGTLPKDMPDMTRARLLESLAAKPVVKEGVLDTVAYKMQVEAAAKAELEYLAKATGSGRITGMGSAAPSSGVSIKEAFQQMYLRMGKPQAEAENLAALAARGR